MKKLLSVLIALSILGTTAAYAGTAQVPTKKLEKKKAVKKHQRVDGTKVSDDKPTPPAKKNRN